MCGVCEVTSSSQSQKEADIPQCTPVTQGSKSEKGSFINRKTSPNDGSECKERNLEIMKLAGGEARKASSQSLKGENSGSSESDIGNETFDDCKRNDSTTAAYDENCLHSNSLVASRSKEPAQMNRIHNVENEKNDDGSAGKTLSQNSPGTYKSNGNSLLHENKEYLVSQRPFCASSELWEEERTGKGVKDWQRDERQEKRQEDLIRVKKSFQLFALRRQQGRSTKNEASINAPSTIHRTNSDNIGMAENSPLYSACYSKNDVTARKDAWIDNKPIKKKNAKISRWSRLKTAVKIKPSERRKEKDPAMAAEEHFLMIENLKRCGVL